MADTVFSVSQISEYIEKKLLFDPMLADVSVRGEVTNHSLSSRGQVYFSIKDDLSQINCIAFDSAVASDMIQNGAMVIITGEIGYYKKAGRINLIVKSVRKEGEGDLYAAFLRTKEMLEAEGLFDAAHKKPLPPYPMKIGVITSAAGAAMHDIIQVATRRFEGLTVLVFPASVQGADAPATLMNGIDYFNQKEAVDLIIIGRGGGSFEDLFAFNDEKLARKIYDSEIPVVSAVGHEVDYTICDFVSDFRAPTPSAAAELCIPQKADIKKQHRVFQGTDGRTSGTKGFICADRHITAAITTGSGVSVRKTERLYVCTEFAKAYASKPYGRRIKRWRVLAEPAA